MFPALPVAAAQREAWPDARGGAADVAGGGRGAAGLRAELERPRATTNSSCASEAYDAFRADLLPGDLVRLLDEKRLDGASEASTEIGEETRSSTPNPDPMRQHPPAPGAGIFMPPGPLLPPMGPMMPPPLYAGGPLHPPFPMAPWPASASAIPLGAMQANLQAAMLAQYQYYQASLAAHYHAAVGAAVGADVGAPPVAPPIAPRQPSAPVPPPQVAPTTAMLRNLPPEYDRAMLLALLDAEGFAGLYDFVYLPTDFRRNASFGYGFVNFVTSIHAESFRRHIEGFRRWVVPSDRVAEVSWADPLQGLDAHVERYRDSPLMHESVPDIYKPALFSGGARVAFPPPTKRLKAPRVRGRPGREDEAEDFA